MRGDLRLIPQSKDAADLLKIIVHMKGADVLTYSPFIVMFEGGRVALASRWEAA